MVEAFLEQLITNFSYFGIFISSMITSASIIFPLPGQVILVFAVLLKLNTVLTAVLTAIGSMIGELTGYSIGLVSRKASRGKLKKHRKLIAAIRKYYNKYAFWVILLTAFLFFPFDLVGIISGMSKYDIKKFLLAGFIGKFLKTLLILFLIQNGIQLFGFT